MVAYWFCSSFHVGPVKGGCANNVSKAQAAGAHSLGVMIFSKFRMKQNLNSRIAPNARFGLIKKGRARKVKLFALSQSPCGCVDDLSSWQDKSSSQKGWVSIDRSVVAALPSTTPRPVHKSSTDDLGPPLCKVGDRESRRHLQPATRFPGSGWSPETILPRAKRGPDGIVAVSRRDSALEAFRHNPTDGSFAPPAARPSAWTKCPNLRFLSYWAGLLSQWLVISRVKLTCLTTV